MRPLDFAVIALYLAGITWFGARFREGQKTLRDYFLGGRNAPWWAIGFSIVSAETSTLTVIGTPALSFAGDLGFLQVVLGYLLARIAISVLFLPAYFRGELFTAYELMRIRFGDHIRKLTAGAFLMLRALAEGVRVFAISIVVSVMLGPLFTRMGFGSGEIASIVVILCLTLFYTFEGGMTAVIWTDVVQMLLYVGGAVLSFIVILQLVPGGWSHVVETGLAAHKFRVFDFGFSWSPEFFTRTYSFWAGVIGGCFLTTASHGTEQLMVQRLLAARSEGESRAALFGSWVVIFFQFALFLIIGVCLYVYYRENGIAPPEIKDRIYPEFIWEHLPRGVAGLVIAAILAASMSNLSAALNSLASTTIMDFYRPLVERKEEREEGERQESAEEPLGPPAAAPRRPETHYLTLARLATVAWGVVLFAVALIARHWGSVLQAGLSIASIVYGSLLGVFLLGLLTRRTGEIAAMAGMTAGLILMLYVKFYTPIAWTWYVVIGTAATFAVGYAVAMFFPEKRKETI